MDGSSFSFRVLDEELKKEDGKYKREITKVGPVYDVGPVTFPAYEDTTSGYRKEEVVAAEVRAIADKPAKLAEPAPEPEDDESRKLKAWARGLTPEKK
jgi:phage head maturation protease